MVAKIRAQKGNTHMLKEAILNTQNRTYTENGALTNKSTKSAVLDLFALGGAVTKGSNVNLETLISNALYEDTRLALKTIFYLSDIREGQGRRDLFKTGLKLVLKNNTELARKLLPYIPEFGRWDYLYWFIGTELELDVMRLFAAEIVASVNAQKPSLVFKWLASEDASSSETIRNARITRRHFGMESKTYRKMLSEGRKVLNLVERNMSTGNWDKINYEQVPSVAMKKYRKAFIKHNPEYFAKFIKQVQSGEKTIKASVLYPHDILSAGLNSRGLERDTLVAQWNALPNYIEDGIRALPVVDTSGSMGGLPLIIASAIGIYLSTKLTGPFKNTVMSFSQTARLFELNPKQNVFDHYNYLRHNQLNENTNLQSVFDLILKTAIANNLPDNELPNRLIIMSDMEFDNATGAYQGWGRTPQQVTNFEAIKAKYKAAGYTMPEIIFWNVNARNAQTPATMNDQGVILVSGYSPVIMKSVLSNDPYITPYKAMLQTLNQERYAFIDKL